jgi:hypothetical protein
MDELMARYWQRLAAKPQDEPQARTAIAADPPASGRPSLEVLGSADGWPGEMSMEDLEPWAETSLPESSLDSDLTAAGGGDLVSLDDLLEEEERLADGDEGPEDPFWGLRRRFRDRYN